MTSHKNTVNADTKNNNSFEPDWLGVSPEYIKYIVPGI